MYRPVRAVEVYVWGKRAGAVALDPKLGYYAFEYDPEFVATRIELAPLSMPLAEARDPYVFPSLPDLTYRRLPALLADSLPDDFGNALIDAWMASHGIAQTAITSLDRLAYMGKRGLGALEFKPARGPNMKSSTAITLSRLVESARLAVSGSIGADGHTSAALTQIIRVGTSAGGARAKAVIAWNPKSNEIRAGQFDVGRGFEHWILKFDGLRANEALGDPQGYGRIEYAYHRMARAAGMTLPAAHLLEENGRAHFMSKRFDRTHNTKHHVQTLCAMGHLDYRQKATHDASQLFQVMNQLGLGYTDLEEAFRRIAFNVMAANCDDHTKNTSFILRAGGSWELAPAYDVTHAHNPHGEWTSQHLLGVNGKFTGISSHDLLQVADRFA
ncbi:MAG TPA: type II toxin-antitoxin system HipA family toxin, partial [Vicinamibacteria bacterium]|nr:type II toxin-antitoxin system HipA family toxin [Vicinamibacteria bacterium]